MKTSLKLIPLLIFLGCINVAATNTQESKNVTTAKQQNSFCSHKACIRHENETIEGLKTRLEILEAQVRKSTEANELKAIFTALGILIAQFIKNNKLSSTEMAFWGGVTCYGLASIVIILKQTPLPEYKRKCLAAEEIYVTKGMSLSELEKDLSELEKGLSLNDHDLEMIFPKDGYTKTGEKYTLARVIDFLQQDIDTRLPQVKSRAEKVIAILSAEDSDCEDFIEAQRTMELAPRVIELTTQMIARIRKLPRCQAELQQSVNPQPAV